MRSTAVFWLKTGPALALLAALASACTYQKGADGPTPCGVSAAAPATYAAVVRPIFEANCTRCHSQANYLNQGGGQNLDDFVTVQAYAHSGVLLRAIKWTDATPPEVRMPRPTSSRLSECEVARVESWIAAGAAQN